MIRILVVTERANLACEQVALELCDLQHAPMGEVRPPEERFDNWRGALLRHFGRDEPSRYEGPDPRRFDFVIIVFASRRGRFSAPMRSAAACSRPSK